MIIWFARIAWVLLPLTTGGALADALDDWSGAVAFTASVLLWTAWTLGAIALFAPRPWGFTALRVLATAALALAVVASFEADALAAIAAIGGSAVVIALTMSAEVATASANGIAYGDEEHFPLRAPLALLAGPVPVAALVAAAGIATPVLLAADGRWVGALVSLPGVVVALAAVRALHGLARRAVVLVPNGLVVVDPMTLGDPVLVPRDRLVRVAAVTELAPPDGALDLRLGTAPGSTAVAIDGTVTFLRRTRRREGALVNPSEVLVAPLRPAALLDAAARRRLPVA